MNDGGPAFPRPYSCQNIPAQRGMSLRDYFAGQALAGMLAANGVMEEATKVGDQPQIGLAVVAYNIADAMIAERAKETL